jgi:serine/threonine protein kinase
VCVVVTCDLFHQLFVHFFSCLMPLFLYGFTSTNPSKQNETKQNETRLLLQAPEMLTRNGYGRPVDWWSLGTLCYEMLVGKAPFTAKTQKELDRKILSDKFTVPPYLSATTHSFLRGMLEKDMCVEFVFSANDVHILLQVLL